jgi:hypothetical protein
VVQVSSRIFVTPEVSQDGICEKCHAFFGSRSAAPFALVTGSDSSRSGRNPLGAALTGQRPWIDKVDGVLGLVEAPHL